ncbi:hypothetical protein AXG93_1962s1050 [Marchantia polymorpha subsp. ruderalis]|uniref:Uncharacterized protein n=1 Tax=Marchantia polymorpha subsp. ruderalis TaxID=1480154 RepID=A0A176WDD6_MARPO|nr:hypothetical protein AXG93_1962s1050 [Marchantia polymorpha subsp. ruderalis]
MNYLSPLFINFYQGMGLLSAAEQKRFLFERKIVDDEGMLGVNEVASEKDNIAHAPPSTEANKSEDDIEERSVKKRKLKEPAVKPNSVEKLLDRVVAEVEKVVAEQQAMPSCQVSSGTVDFDCDEGPSSEELKTTELSVADILN